MVFWRKDTARDVKNVLVDLQARLARLKDFDRRRETAAGVVAGVLADLELVEREVPVRAEDLKSRPWLDARFDREIDEMAAYELRAIAQLEKDLALWGKMTAEAENEKELDIVAQTIVNEGKEIVSREESNERLVKGFEDGTSMMRMRHPSLDPPAEKTSDGVSLGAIANVVRELGGWLGAAPRGSTRVVFPGGRSFLVTQDLSARRIAEGVVAVLRIIWPAYKVPPVDEMINAFRMGKLRTRV